MGWKDLLAQPNESQVLPWTGGHRLHSPQKSYRLRQLPAEFGWYRFKFEGRRASVLEESEADPELLTSLTKGYLVGQRLIPDHARVDTQLYNLHRYSEVIYMVPEGLERFSRVTAGRIYPEGPLIFKEEDFPLGPEEEVLSAYLNRDSEVSSISGVTPALDVAFRMLSYRRNLAERRRIELQERRARELQEQEQAQLMNEYLTQLTDGRVRRALAQIDFAEAARAALEIGGAEYLDHRIVHTNEWIVTYRINGMRLECTCNQNLQIIDAGVCLTNELTGERGDTYFTLESLPGVILQAEREGVLVIWRRG
jgi:hypothetical protein